jgi:NitT/TauT family transport system permease protein
MKSVRTGVGLLILWELVVYLLQMPEFLLPAPHVIMQRLFNELTLPYMHAHITVTLLVSLQGLFQGALLGVITGWVFYHNPFIRDHLAWIAMGSQAIPVIALAPLLLIWIPETYWARVCVATIITFFPIYAATYTALHRIPTELREVARLFGATRLQTFVYLESIQAAPVVLSGIQTSMALATTGAVVGEFLGGRDGLGALINVARGLFDTTLVFVSITLLVVITIIFHFVLKNLVTKIYAIADGLH